MSLPIQTQAKYWAIAGLVLIVLLWLLGDVLLPFVLGAALAYFLDPVADRLERLGLSRVVATSVIALVAVLIFVLLVLSIIPTLIQQLMALIESAPEISKKLQGFLVDRFPELADRTSTLRQTLAELGETVKAQGGKVVGGLIQTAFGAVSIVLVLLVAPVVTFYLLLDWDRMIARTDALLPRQHIDSIRQIASEIDVTLAGFLRGQVMVCLILGAFYAIALMAAGLQYGLIVGALAGAITFIPYIGALFGGVLAIGLALFQFWGDWFSIGIIVAIFAVGQFAEGNILSPKLVGQSVGLHPVWLLLALSAFGSLFGFVGMLVAVPVAAVIGVLVRFGVAQYQNSPLFIGEQSVNPLPTQPARSRRSPLKDADRAESGDEA
ncbi:AI-2E family transporter [Rhodobacter sp. 24-YEA-8]|uniref:AI-2E family transporter n=1 Tax=Rhodobacter sp. 24-YEA-8 TaxID=1884310 RepID=UPI0008988B2B|nr:AI-2E family transporter [Rhodobacter sp. 24-YEA-8]SEC44102.1 Predicted PurR-regulated permease PerM [Rhodobacter sp. 24-YEA-8]